MTEQSRDASVWPSRVSAAAIAIFWSLAFLILILYVPASARVMAALWAVTAVFAPRFYLLSLVAALPLFGNNPGGPHHLYLLDMGLMAYVVRRNVERAIWPKPAPAAADALPALLALAFLALSTGALIPQMKRIYCEIATEGTRFLFANYFHYGNSPVFGIHTWMCLALSVSFYECLRCETAGAQARRVMMWGLVSAAFVASVIGLLEYANLLSLEQWRPDNPYITRFGYKRVQSLFWHSGWFGQYLAAVSPIALAFTLTGRSRTRYIAGGMYVILGVTELFTMQRGAWLGFAAGSAAVAAGFVVHGVQGETRRIFLRRAAAVCGSMLALLVIAALIHAPLRHRMLEMTKASDRAGLWGAAWEMGMHRPLTGMGFGNYTSVHRWLFTEGSPYFTVDDKTTAHNLLLHTFAERGALAALTLAAVLGLAVVGISRSLLRRKAEGDGNTITPVERLALVGGLVGIAVDGIFQYSFYIRLTEIIVWLYFAWASRCFIVLPRMQKLFAASWLRAGVVVLCVGLFLYAMRDSLVASDNIYHPSAGWFYTAGEQVELEIPPGGTNYSILVYSADPKIPDGEPVTLAFWHGDNLVGTHVFTKFEPAEIRLFFPRDRDPETKLKIIASRVWNPYQATERMIGKLEAGVCYKNFRPLDSSASKW